MNRYNPSFIKDIRGNVLPQGSDLTVQVIGATIVTSQLFKKTFFGWKLIQIDQSGYSKNPQKDQIVFEMRQFNRKTRKVESMPVGTYRIRTKAYIPETSSYMNGWKSDVFEII